MLVYKARYNSIVINSSYKANLWMLISFFLLISNTGLVYFSILSDVPQKTIVLPPKLTKSFSIQGDTVSSTYLEQITRYFAHLLFTYQPKNVQAQFNVILSYTDPGYYNAMKRDFDEEVNKIKSGNIISVFHPMSINVTGSEAVLTGQQKAYIGEHLVRDSERTYKFVFDYRQGHLYLVELHEVIN
jgi:conjugal transfer pilus assembly protein TraE